MRGEDAKRHHRYDRRRGVTLAVLAGTTATREWNGTAWPPSPAPTSSTIGQRSDVFDQQFGGVLEHTYLNDGLTITTNFKVLRDGVLTPLAANYQPTGPRIGHFASLAGTFLESGDGLRHRHDGRGNWLPEPSYPGLYAARTELWIDPLNEAFVSFGSLSPPNPGEAST